MSKNRKHVVISGRLQDGENRYKFVKVFDVDGGTNPFIFAVKWFSHEMAAEDRDGYVFSYQYGTMSIKMIPGECHEITHEEYVTLNKYENYGL